MDTETVYTYQWQDTFKPLLICGNCQSGSSVSLDKQHPETEKNQDLRDENSKS